MNIWEENVKVVEQIYGCHIGWDERFYECPCCGEPIYECDWSEETLTSFICPLCEFREDEELDDCDYEVGYDPYMGCFTDDC